MWIRSVLRTSHRCSPEPAGILPLPAILQHAFHLLAACFPVLQTADRDRPGRDPPASARRGIVALRLPRQRVPPPRRRPYNNRHQAGKGFRHVTMRGPCACSLRPSSIHAESDEHAHGTPFIAGWHDLLFNAHRRGRVHELRSGDRRIGSKKTSGSQLRSCIRRIY